MTNLQPWRSNYPTWRLRPGVYLSHDKRWAEVKQDDGRWLLIRLHEDGGRQNYGMYADSEAALREADRLEKHRNAN